jgi:hypothetical protein
VKSRAVKKAAPAKSKVDSRKRLAGSRETRRPKK